MATGAVDWNSGRHVPVLSYVTTSSSLLVEVFGPALSLLLSRIEMISTMSLQVLRLEDVRCKTDFFAVAWLSFE